MDRLEALEVGMSTPADVLLVLGEPRGHGMARFPVESGPRTLWFYEYVVVTGSRIEAQTLLIFFREERYEGHLWFSSAHLLQKGN